MYVILEHITSHHGHGDCGGNDDPQNDAAPHDACTLDDATAPQDAASTGISTGYDCDAGAMQHVHGEHDGVKVLLTNRVS